MFKTMKQEDVFAALEGVEDILTSELKKEEAFLRQHVCPMCGSGCQKETRPNLAFHDSLVPRCTLKCLRCSYAFDPRTGMTLETGDSRIVTKIPGQGQGGRG